MSLIRDIVLSVSDVSRELCILLLITITALVWFEGLSVVTAIIVASVGTGILLFCDGWQTTLTKNDQTGSSPPRSGGSENPF